MKYLFNKEIYNWDSWGKVYQSIEDFEGLIKEIFIREKLSRYEEISHLTPGTNAVFRVGDYVIKIFAPKESGANADEDYKAEMEAMKRAIEKGINTPNILAASSIEDKYLFRYFVMDYIEGEEAGKVLPKYSLDKKLSFVRELKENLAKLNINPAEKIDKNLLKQRAIKNARWNEYSEDVRLQIKEILLNLELPQFVYVHGDITADNVIIDNTGKLFIIDFADSKIAPMEYEYPPIIFDLFNFDLDMIHKFTIGMNYDEFIAKLFVSLLLHEFGAYFVRDIYRKYTGKESKELMDIYEIREIIYSSFKPV